LVLIRRIVKEEDVYLEGSDDYGYEEKPHITVAYGIHDNEVIDKSVIYNIFKDMSQITFSVNEIGVFENENYDVVKFNINPTKQLLNIREKFLFEKISE
jgi:hypothetical protein